MKLHQYLYKKWICSPFVCQTESLTSSCALRGIKSKNISINNSFWKNAMYLPSNKIGNHVKTKFKPKICQKVMLNKEPLTTVLEKLLNQLRKHIHLIQSIIISDLNKISFEAMQSPTLLLGKLLILTIIQIKSTGSLTLTSKFKSNYKTCINSRLKIHCFNSIFTLNECSKI